MGPYKSLKEVRRTVLDCMENIHPIYRIKLYVLFIEGRNNSHQAGTYDQMRTGKGSQICQRISTNFRKRYLTTSDKTARKNEAIARKGEVRKVAGKNVYTPFPWPQPPRKVDLQLEGRILSQAA